MRNLIDMDFLVVGAQKCATSWLYYCLRDHPEVYLPEDKQEDVYLGGDLHREHGTDWYFQQVGGDGHQIGDVSVDYLFDPQSPQAVHEAIPGTKIIASLRHPIDRAISSYYWNLRRGNVREMNLGDGMRRVLQKRHEAERPDLPYNPSNYYVNILARGLYDIQVRRYLEYFASDQLLLLPYNQIRQQGPKILDRIYEFVGVDSSFRPSMLNQTRRPKQNSYRSSLLQFERDTPNTPFWGRISNLAHQMICQLGLHREQPALPDDVETKLRNFFRSHIRDLFDLVQEIPASKDLWTDVSWLQEDSTEEILDGSNAK
jgi:hypothetical protein